MGVEGHDRALAAQLRSPPGRAPQQCGVAQVYPVKKPQGEYASIISL
jgi:hypothetical protein